jgi:N-acetylneuraminic acid mutarotase
MSCGQQVTPVYDAGAGGSWSSAPSAPRARAFAQAAASGGKLYLVGGIVGGKGVDWVDVFDPGTRLWTTGPSLPPDAPRHHLALATNADSLYILGGFGEGFAPSNSTYVLNGSDWMHLADQPVLRGGATAQAIDGKIYVAGGGDDDSHARLDVYGYDVRCDTWSRLMNMPTERQDAASCVLQGKLVVVGGRLSLGKAVVAVTQAFDPALDTWTLEVDMPTPRSALAATTIGDTCYALGGEEPNVPGGVLGTVAGFSLGRGWISYPDMPTSRRGLAAASLGGQIYAAAGDATKAGDATAVLEIFTVSP